MTLIATPRPDGHLDVYEPSYGSLGERTTAAEAALVIMHEWIDRADSSRRRAAEAAFRGKPRKAAALCAEADKFLERAGRYFRRAQAIRACRIEGVSI